MEYMTVIKHMDDKIEIDGWYPRAESEYHPLPLYVFAGLAVLSRQHDIVAIEYIVGDFTEDEIMLHAGLA